MLASNLNMAESHFCDLAAIFSSLSLSALASWAITWRVALLASLQLVLPFRLALHLLDLVLQLIYFLELVLLTLARLLLLEVF